MAHSQFPFWRPRTTVRSKSVVICAFQVSQEQNIQSGYNVLIVDKLI